MRIGLLACVVLVGCAKKPAEQDVAKPIESSPSGNSAASHVVIAPDSAPVAAKPAPPPDCAAALGDIMSDVRGSFVAKNTFSPRKEALRKWPLVPDACHTGLWYLEAAILIGQSNTELTAGNVKLTSEEAALTLALQQPDDVDVLKQIAFISALGRKPALPDDACKRAQAIDKGDKAAYVCARAAIAAGDGKTAKEQLASIKFTRPFADYELAVAQAAKLNKDTKTMKAQAKLAQKEDYDRAGFAMIKEGDRKAIIELAKKLK